MSGMVSVLLFASVRGALGQSAETLMLPPAISTIGALRDHLTFRGALWTVLTATRNLRSALNQQMCSFDAFIRAGGEIAFFRP